MADEVLTQAELETLLNTAGPAGPFIAANTDERSLLSPQASTAPAAAAFAKPRDKLQAYDFKRPDRVRKQHVRAIEALHENLGSRFATALSALLRTVVDAKLVSVDQLTYHEFTAGLTNPTCLNVLRAAPLEQRLLLDLSPTILYPMIDRMLGGGGREPANVARRPLTDIELRLMARITRMFLEELKKSWEQTVQVQLSVERVDCDPHRAPVMPPNEIVAVINLELSIGGIRGAMKLCLPFNTLEQIAGPLLSGGIDFGRGQPSLHTIAQMSANVRLATVEVVASLAETKISTSDMLGLRVGDIITTEKDQHSPLAVLVEGVEKFRARAGQLKGRKAIQIDDPRVPDAPDISHTGR